MRTSKLFTAILFVLLVFSYLACKKTDSITDKAVRPTDRFFVVPSNAPRQIKAIAKALEKQNDEHHYLSSIIKTSGYPKWDKARIVNFNKGTVSKGEDGMSGEVVYIPFVKDSDNYVNSLLAVKMDPSDTIYRMLHDYNYRKFGYDTTDKTKWSARDVFNIFSSFDHSVFGHTKFLVLDHQILKAGKDSLKLIATIGKQSAVQVPTGKTSSEIAIEECNTWHVCIPYLLARAMDGACYQEFDIDICTTYGGGGGGDGSYGGWTGSGSGTGDPSTGGGSGGTGWYGGSDPCSSSILVSRNTREVPVEGCGSGWVPVPNDSYPVYQYVATEQETGLTDNDPNLIWWNETTSDPNTLYTQQQRPTWDRVNQNYPKNSNETDDLPVHDVCVLIGGEVLAQHNAGNANNGCALRVSRSLNYSGIVIPKIQGQTWQGADGKNYFYRAEFLYNWMVKTFGQPDIHLTAADGAPDGTTFKDKLIGRGIYIMKPRSQQSFGASGHATLWGGLNCVGGHNYFAAASDIYLWRLTQ